MSTSDEQQHAPEPRTPADEPAPEAVVATGSDETEVLRPVADEEPVQVADERPAPAEGAPAPAAGQPQAVADEKPAAESLGAEEPGGPTPPAPTSGPTPAPAPSPEPGPSPAPPAPGAPSTGPATAPTTPPPTTPGATAATPAAAATSAAWRPPTATPALGTAQPVRPSMPSPAPADETARHAALRPTPVPPGPPNAPTAPLPSGLPQRTPLGGSAPAAATGAGAGLAGAAGAAGAAAGAAAGEAAGKPVTGTAGAAGAAAGTAAGAAAGAAAATGTASTKLADTVPGTPAATTPSSELFPDPNAPRTITVGTHVLGVIVGILLPLASAIVTVLGISRILAVEADGWAAKVDVLGIVLVTLGVLLLLACALLSLWTPSVGLVGGTILTAVGGFALYAPGLTRTGVLDVLTSEGWEPTVVQSVVVATSGTVVAIGVLLLGAGIVSSAARRHGIHLGAFRERHRTA